MRAAFTMLELIFAIVILSVALFTIPMISQILSVEKNFTQEAIFITSSDVLKIISGKFDENSRIGDENYERILYTSDAEAISLNLNGSRSGNINILFHSDTTLRPTITGLDNDEEAQSSEDDVDDYKTSSDISVISGSIKENSYKTAYKKSVRVQQNSFHNEEHLNTKRVEVTLKSEDGIKELVKMHTYTFNTGNTAISPYRDLP